MQKLGYVKGKLQAWNRSTFGNLKANMDKLNEELIVINKTVEEELGILEELRLQRRDVVASLNRNIKAKEML